MASNSESSAALSFAGGAVAGLANLMAGHPFDTVKVRMQTEGRFGRFTSPIDCLRQTMKYEGIPGLYKGVTAPMVGKFLVHSTMFGVNAELLRSLAPAAPGEDAGPFRRDIPLSTVVFAGSVTGVVTSVIITPIEQVKTAMQAQYSWAAVQPSVQISSAAGARSASGAAAVAAVAVPVRAVPPLYTGSFDCARKLVMQHGIAQGLFKYTIPTVVEMSLLGAYFGGYAVARRALTVEDGTREGKLSAPRAVLAGGLGGMCMSLVCFPTDVIKARLMAQPRVPGKPDKYRGFFDCAGKLYAAEGIGAFYKGLTPGLMRTFFANAATFFAFEFVTKTLPERL